MDKQKLPKKNIHPVLADVRDPKKKLFFPERDESPDWGIGPSRRSRFVKGTLLLTLVAVLIGGMFLGFQLFSLKNQLARGGEAIYGSFREVADYFKSLEIKRASDSLSNVDEKIKNLDEQFKFFSVIPVLKEVPETFAKLQELTAVLRSANQSLMKLEEGGIGLFFGEGEGALPILENMEDNLNALNDISIDLRNRLTKFGGLPVDFDSSYLALVTNLSRLREGLSSVIGLLGSSENRHLLVIFENPSEMRPGGGFVGSYADLTLYQGKIKDIDVNDIYYPDKFLKLKVVPPLQIQGTTVDWGARDANWFFDFPTSAGKIAEFIEASPIYSDRKITFDGVVALNVRVIEDVLAITGPIELKEYKLVLDDANFLKQVQYEVEAGRDKKPGQNPKRILKAITPILLEKLKGLDEVGKRDLLQAIGYRLKNKDIMAYFKDKTLENFAVQLGIGGEVYPLPSRFNGDYLAVVNANVGGGKSDAFVKETIVLSSKISERGSLVNNLTVKRKHEGNKEKESWYKVINQNFIKIFTPPDSRLEFISGNSSKVVKAGINYGKAGYNVDGDLKSIEDTREILDKYNAEAYREFGKKVFAAWFNVPAGSSKELNLNYSEETRISLENGAIFEFILDKQSGVEADFRYSIEAPAGFIFTEANDPVFHYESQELPGRLIIKLTLKRMVSSSVSN